MTAASCHLEAGAGLGLGAVATLGRSRSVNGAVATLGRSVIGEGTV